MKAPPVDDRDEGRSAPSAHVFLSYASEDREIAEWLRDRLLGEHIAATVWLDRKEIVGGDAWQEEIHRGLLRSNILLAIVTDHSNDVHRNRQWILFEQEEADRLLRRIVPLRFTSELPDHLTHLQWVDFLSVDRQAGFLTLQNVIGKYVARSGRALPNQSPPMESAFIGREVELKEILARLDEDTGRVQTAHRPLAICGMGGLGKTMVAYELVRRLAPRFPGGVIVETRGDSPAPARIVLQRWAALAIGRTPDREHTVGEVLALLEGFGELLVLIDDVAGQDFQETKTLLTALPPDATRVLTTRSQDVAGPPLGCVLYPLGRLSETDAIGLVHDRLRARLGQALSHFEFGLQFDRILPSLKDLVRRVDGHALAIELAAGRFDYIAEVPQVVADLIESLEQGVDGLQSPAAWDVSRETSVAVSLDLSLEELRRFDRLKRTNLADLFIDFGIFPDGARMDADLILAVWGIDNANTGRPLLAGIHQRSLVRRDARTGYYSLHPLLRSFTYRLLADAPERQRVVQDRYTRHVIERARTALARPLHEWQAWLVLYVPHVLRVGEVLLQEIEPVLGGLDRWATPEAVEPLDPDPPSPDVSIQFETMLDFALAVSSYVIRRPALAERGHRILQAGLASARRLGRRPSELVLLRTLGGWHALRTPPLARRFFEAGLAIVRSLGIEEEEGAILSYLGEVERTCSRFDVACTLLNQALAIHQRRHDRAMEAKTLKYLGETRWRLAEYDEAMKCYGEALRATNALGDVAAQGDLLNKIGSVEFSLGQLLVALPFFECALEIHREVADVTNEAVDLNDLGITNLYLGRMEEATELLNQALPLHRAVGNRNVEAITLSNLASARLGRGEPAEALALTETALGIARDVENKVTESWVLTHRGRAFEALGRFDSALESLETAASNLRAINNPRGLAGCLGYLSSLLGTHLDRREEALTMAREGLAILMTSGTDQAFGGRRASGFRELIERFSQEAEV